MAVKVTCLGTSSTVKVSLTHEFRRQHPLHNGPPAASGTARERLSENGLGRLHFLHHEIRSILVAVPGNEMSCKLYRDVEGFRSTVPEALAVRPIADHWQPSKAETPGRAVLVTRLVSCT